MRAGNSQLVLLNMNARATPYMETVMLNMNSNLNAILKNNKNSCSYKSMCMNTDSVSYKQYYLNKIF